MRGPKPKRKAFAPVHVGSVFEFPAAFTELDKIRREQIREGLKAVLHSRVDCATFCEVYRKRDQVTQVLKSAGFDVVYDIENRRVQVRVELGDVEF